MDRMEMEEARKCTIKANYATTEIKDYRSFQIYI